MYMGNDLDWQPATGFRGLVRVKKELGKDLQGKVYSPIPTMDQHKCRLWVTNAEAKYQYIDIIVLHVRLGQET